MGAFDLHHVVLPQTRIEFVRARDLEIIAAIEEPDLHCGVELFRRKVEIVRSNPEQASNSLLRDEVNDRFHAGPLSTSPKGILIASMPS